MHKKNVLFNNSVIITIIMITACTLHLELTAMNHKHNTLNLTLLTSTKNNKTVTASQKQAETEVVNGYQLYAPLVVAAQGGCQSAREFLLKNPSTITHCDDYGWSALHAASACGNWEVVALLLEHNANINWQNNTQQTPLDVARESYKRNKTKQLKKVIKLLTSHNASPTPTASHTSLKVWFTPKFTKKHTPAKSSQNT